MNYNNKSIWLDYKKKEKYPKLDNNISCDVLIIGGGMTGINAAYQLINSNLKVFLVERNEIAQGVTSKTTGKITYLQENIYSKINLYHGSDNAKLYLDSQKEAISIIKNIIDKEKINCDMQSSKSYIINNNKRKYNEELDLLKKFNVTIKVDNKLPNNESVKNTFFIEDSYVFHPLKYLYSLAKVCRKNNIDIYENTKITEIKKVNNIYECISGTNVIKTKYIILALHYPYFLLPYLMPFKTTIEKSYVKAYKTDINYQYDSITVTKPTFSTRYWQENNNIYKIVLNNSHNSCTKFNDLDNFYQLYNYDKGKVDYIWSNEDIITNDALPFIGQLDDTGTLLIGTGYNTWGMTNGTIAGKILSDIILKKENKYVKLFDPLRKINIGKVTNLPISLGSSACSFIKTKINKKKRWYPKNVKFEKRDGINIAIYIDENKKEHIVYNMCPHLKCSLLFNSVEKTWDCPCHGSRFDIDGKCIKGPSGYDITYKE